MRTIATLIAPVPPFRGGIAKHSEAFARALCKIENVDLYVESFSRLYPKFLYPGESERDEGTKSTLEVPVRYDLDTLAPWTWQAAVRRISVRGGIVFIPAWTFFVAPMLGTIAKQLRKHDVQVVMIVHNAFDHEATALKAKISKYQLSKSDFFLTHTTELANQLKNNNFSQATSVLPIPAFIDGPDPVRLLPREYDLELLCFGLVRFYKGVDIALNAIAQSGLKNVRLTIAGEIWDNKDHLVEIIENMPINVKVELIDRYVSDVEAAELFTRCDAVLAPYRTVTGSAVMAMAQRYRRPVVASDLPGLAMHITHGENGWLFPAGDVAALAILLATSVTRQATQGMQPKLSPPAADWNGYALAALEIAAGSSD